MHQKCDKEHLIHGPRHMTTRVSRYMATGCDVVYFSPADISFMALFIQLNQCITDRGHASRVMYQMFLYRICDALIQGMEPHGFTTSKTFSKFGIQNSEFGIQISEFGIQNSVFGIRNSEFGIQNSEFGIVNSNGNRFAGP